jgi:hypothetical protein
VGRLDGRMLTFDGGVDVLVKTPYVHPDDNGTTTCVARKKMSLPTISTKSEMKPPHIQAKNMVKLDVLE